MTDILGKVIYNRGHAANMTEVQQLIDKGEVTVNGELAEKWDQKVFHGDMVKIEKRKTVIVE